MGSGGASLGQSLGSGTNGGSAAISYGREISAQTGQGRVIALGEDWQPKIISIAIAPIKPSDPASQLVRLVMRSNSLTALHPSSHPIQHRNPLCE